MNVLHFPDMQTMLSKVPPLDRVYILVIGALLLAAGASAMKFLEAQESIEHRAQIGMAMTDSYIAQARRKAADRDRPEAAATADALMAEATASDDDPAATRAGQRRGKQGGRSRHHQTADRTAPKGW
jgi:hypothetical protein